MENSYYKNEANKSIRIPSDILSVCRLYYRKGIVLRLTKQQEKDKQECKQATQKHGK